MNIDELIIHNKLLEQQVNELTEKLKKYTAPTRSKTYYEKHKNEIIQKTKEYKENTNYYSTISAEKKKEYARRAYLNKKEKIKTKNEKTTDENI
jgi:hypothetical protein